MGLHGLVDPKKDRDSILYSVRVENAISLQPCQAKAIVATGHGGLKDCEMLRIPHCLDNRLTDGGKVVSLTRLPHTTLQNIIFLLLVPISVRGVNRMA
jgi:hypothetical protein